MRSLVEALGNPQDKLKVVHIAGTSGKTSTAYYVTALLSAAGLKAGLTVSPHVDEINERVQINGEPLSEAEFCKELTVFAGLVEGLGLEISRFEFMTAFAYWYFAKAGVDYAVVEVGLGGLKDGTNVVTRPDKIAVITDIGLDHTHLLGKTLPEIAGQKVGVVRPGNAAFTFRPEPDILDVYEQWCKAHKAELRVIEPPQTDDYRLRNWQLAYEVYKYLTKRDGLPVLSEKILGETRQTSIPGRLDMRQIGDKTLIMDGAHNAQKMTAFLTQLEKLYPGENAAFLISIKKGKDYQVLADLIRTAASRVIATSFKAEQDMPVRSMEPAELAAAVGGQAIEDQAEAVKVLLSGPEKICVITGSFYLLGQIRNSKLLA